MSIYCVYITTYSGNKLPPFYIGSTSISKVKAGYHGSVKSKDYMHIWKSELECNPTKFSTRIIRQFNTRHEAFLCEQKLQLQLNVIKNPLYINKSVAYSPLGTCNKGRKFTDKHKANLSAGIRLGIAVKHPNGRPGPRLGMKTSEATKQKMRATWAARRVASVA